MKQHTLIVLMGLFSFIFGCSDNKSSQVHKLVEITSCPQDDEGWHDIILKIVDDDKSDSSHIYVVKGLYKGRTVGLQIEVKSSIKPGIIDDKIDAKSGFVSDAAILKSIGGESDEFIKALAELYNVTPPKGFTKKAIRATAFSLNEKFVNLDKPYNCKLKLFFEEDNENLYSEIFLNIDTKRREIEFREKDQEYREAIIKVLTQ